jgi:copper chaperone CopZ
MVVPWVVDKGLEKLRAQVNAAAPGRSIASDGGIGDAAHAATESDHNPEHPPPAGNPDFQVDARDFTHDPAHGADMNVMAEALRVSKDPRIKYVIWNRRIFSGRNGPQPWVWRTYTGTADPHTQHLHISVEDDTHDQVQAWSIGIGASVAIVYEQYDRDRVSNASSNAIEANAGVKDVKASLAALRIDVTGMKADIAAIKAVLGGVTLPPDPEALRDLIRGVLAEQHYTVNPVVSDSR